MVDRIIWYHGTNPLGRCWDLTKLLQHRPANLPIFSDIRTDFPKLLRSDNLENSDAPQTR